MTPDIQELKRLAEAARDAKIDGAGGWAWAAFHKASTPSIILALIEENKRLAKLIRVLLENEPDDLVADGGHTVLDEWRYRARAALKETTDV